VGRAHSLRRDEQWPVRQDQHLADGVDPAEVDWYLSASILHSNGDEIDIAVKDGRIVGVRGDSKSRVNHGRLGPKDLFGWQANASPDRLTRPLVREAGELRETSWDDAMERIVARSEALLVDKGPGAFGFYTSGQLFLEDYYTLSVMARAGVGTNHLDGNTRLCTATAGEALKESFGCDGQPGSYSDVDHADAICCYGHNVAETQTVLWMRMLDRLHGNDRPRLLVVDPRPTPVAAEAEIHLAIRSATNLALLNAILHELIARDWIDHDYVEANAVGFEGLEATVRGCTPEWAAELCGVGAGEIVAAAELIGTTERLLSTVLQGVYQSHQATASACQVNNIHILRGMLGRPGCGVLQMNGQPTAQNTRETGANGDLPGFRNWANDAHVKGSRARLERGAAADPALWAADPRDGDLPVLRGGLDQPPLGERDQPGGVAAGASAHTRDPRARGPFPCRSGHLSHGDRSLRGRRAAGGHLGREARHLHQRRPHGAPEREGRRTAG
jgi:anaerobic selenocysteine-containing dehydrogenase